jgi:hypothetical protein
MRSFRSRQTILGKAAAEIFGLAHINRLGFVIAKDIDARLKWDCTNEGVTPFFIEGLAHDFKAA